MVTVNVSDLKARLSEYTRRVKAGETVIVCERNVPIGEFRPLPAGGGVRPAPGALAGMIEIGDRFFSSDAEIEHDFMDGLS